MIRQPDVLQVASADIGGGAERVAWDLFRAYRARGLGSWLAVGRKRSDDPDVFAIGGGGTAPAAVVARVRRRKHGSNTARMGRLALRALRDPGVLGDHLRGVEDFRFPASHRVLDLPPRSPGILHCHNLHGSYFDLRALPQLAARVPTVMTLHDAWLLSGHCAHSFDCDRWLTGCGDCPDLTIYPSLRRDGTRGNWQRKRDIFAASHVSLAAPCRWLIERAQYSLLGAAAAEMRLIPYGIDLDVFRPGDRAAARRELSLPEDVLIVLFAAKRIRGSRWRDYETLREAISALRVEGRRVLCIALGDEDRTQRLGDTTEIRIVSFVRDPHDVARYYRSADVYVHPALVDTFPNSVLEALACGLPVVATKVGGIPEQITDGETGILVEPRDAAALTRALERLLRDRELRRAFGARAAEDARQRFALEREVDDYLELYAAADDRLSRAAGERVR